VPCQPIIVTTGARSPGSGAGARYTTLMVDLIDLRFIISSMVSFSDSVKDLLQLYFQANDGLLINLLNTLAMLSLI